MKYEERIVAFIDILGFKDLLGETVKKDEAHSQNAIDKILGAYKLIRKVLDLDDQNVDDARQVTLFSDCIVVSFRWVEEGELYWTISIIQNLLLELVGKGILCRGGIVKGKCIHTDEYLFGPALVEAYALESSAANYPRVVLEQKIIELGVEYRSSWNSPKDERDFLTSFLGQDSDGLYYIDYFYSAIEELDDSVVTFPHYAQNLYEVIALGLKNSSHYSKVSIRVKYLWMAKRYNEMIKKLRSEISACKLRRDGHSDVADAYEALSLFEL